MSPMKLRRQLLRHEWLMRATRSQRPLERVEEEGMDSVRLRWLERVEREPVNELSDTACSMRILESYQYFADCWTSPIRFS